MTGSFGKRACLLLFVVFAAFPAVGYAQDAVLTGTITDATGGVLPGVTVTAVNEATGNSFVSVTDGTGTYRMPVRVGGYRVTAELQGFTTVQRTGVRLLVGENIGVNLQMSPSTIQETVTVTAEAPLIEVNTSSLGGNIDPAQVQELPVQGRNWMALAHARARQPDHAGTSNDPLPDRNGGEVREYPAPHRRPAGHAGPRHRRAAALQPGLDRRVPVHLQPVRRHDGAVLRRAGEGDHALGHEQASRVCFAPTSVTTRSTPRIRSSIACCRWRTSSSAVTRRRADRAGPAPLLRQLRVRAGAEDQRLEYAVSGVQRHAERQGSDQDGRRASRLPALAEQPHHGQVARGAALRSVRRRQRQPSGGHRLLGRAQPRSPRPAHAGVQQHDCQRVQGRLLRVRLRPGWLDQLVEPLAGAQRHDRRVAAHPVHAVRHHAEPELAAHARPGRPQRPRRPDAVV